MQHDGEYVIPVQEWKYLQINPIDISTKVIGHISTHLDAEYVTLIA